jgi:acyl dehydratase
MADGFSTLPKERFLEDYKVGATYLCGSITVSEAEIIDFATRYDPQVMHVDPVLAAKGPFGQVIASGWHTVGLTMQLLVANFLPHNNLASPGIDELRWTRPVRPGDTLTVRVTVTDARRSRSKPDRGMIHGFIEVLNQDNEVVMTLRPMNLVPARTLNNTASRR